MLWFLVVQWRHHIVASNEFMYSHLLCRWYSATVTCASAFVRPTKWRSSGDLFPSRSRCTYAHFVKHWEMAISSGTSQVGVFVDNLEDLEWAARMDLLLNWTIAQNSAMLVTPGLIVSSLQSETTKVYYSYSKKEKTFLYCRGYVHIFFILLSRVFFIIRLMTHRLSNIYLSCERTTTKRHTTCFTLPKNVIRLKNSKLKTDSVT